MQCLIVEDFFTTIKCHSSTETLKTVDLLTLFMCFIEKKLQLSDMPTLEDH